MFWFDGWKLEHGLLDFGVDGDDRRRRHQSGQIPLNGSLGEIYRNFHYIPDVPRSTEDVISTFYSRYDKRSFTNAFDEGEYREELKLAMNISIGATSNKLERYQVEQLYPNFRGRFWTGRDAQINQRFGPMFFPYLECQAISHTAKVPMKYKDMGYLQGKMIALTHDRLANYPSDYGFPLAGKRPVSYKLKSFISTHRSPSVRKWAFRLQHRTKQVFPRSLRDCYLEPVVNLDFPVMAKLFNIDRVYSAQQYGLIATLEIFAERYGMKI
jgi:asparagine synthase (glutamine-hydrolysing)